MPFSNIRRLLLAGLHGETAVLGDIGGVADVSHLLALIGHQFRERDAHEVAVAVQHQHALAGHRLALHDLRGREHVRQGSVGAGEWGRSWRRGRRPHQ